MKGRDSQQDVKSIVTSKSPITVKDIRGKRPDHSYFIRKQARHVHSFFSDNITRLTHTKHKQEEKMLMDVNSADHKHLVVTKRIDDKKADSHGIVSYFSKTLTGIRNSLQSLYPISRSDFNKYVWPAITSALGFMIGEFTSSQLSRMAFSSDEYDFVFKFLMGSAILGYSAAQRITDARIESPAAFAAAVASEIVGITYLYSSSFRFTQHIVSGSLPDKYALIASLGMSTLGVPGAAASLAKAFQHHSVKRQYAKGAQRSDTALMSSGRTPVANNYLQINDAVVKAMQPASSLYQGALIIDNILGADNAVNQAKNVPALIGDIAPAIYKKIIDQQTRIEKDYQYNIAKETVLRFIDGKPQFLSVEHYQLRNGDLVYCDENFDTSSSPVSGEVVALKRDEKGMLTQQYAVSDYRFNLKANNGEDVWIQSKTQAKPDDSHQHVDLQAIREGKQNGILNGTKMDLKGQNDFFIRIKEEKERTLTSGYEKTAVINSIITQHKTSLVKASIYSSLFFALFVSRDIYNLPANTLKWMFNLFQMLIPFAETFLRDRVNKTLLDRLNILLHGREMAIIDALRLVDFLNALSGYYQDRFPNGVAIISDKTGTLTTSTMNVHGFWTSDMPPDVQRSLQESKSFKLPEEKNQKNCFEVFACAFTNHSKESEPEEAAIREFFHHTSAQYDFKVETLANHHYRKYLKNNTENRIIETMHLGLLTKLGGRFTLAIENNKKYLVFCGVPRVDQFASTPLLTEYQKMTPRTGILSRDWCLARCELSEEEFVELSTLFTANNPKQTEAYLCSKPDVLNRFLHHGTFLIDNPVKKGAERFISNCRSIDVPVFVATGDNAKASENIARVLCPSEAKNIMTIRHSTTAHISLDGITAHSTVVFAGLNDNILRLFDQLMALNIEHRPVIIFSEMSTEGKGILAQYLKNKGYFIAANGDHTNDIAMMQQAHVVFSHLPENGTYAPGIEQFSNLNDKQLQLLFHSDKSFYELFDIHERHSQFMRLLAPLMNSQEKPTTALKLKNVKMSFELARSIGLPNVQDMCQQHWAGVAFDLVWLGISYNEIIKSAHMPADEKHLMQSDNQQRYLLAALAIAALESAATYAISGEATNVTWMLLMLSFLPLVLRSIFSSYGETCDEVNAPASTVTIEEVKDEPEPISVVDRRNLVLFRTPDAAASDLAVAAPAQASPIAKSGL